MSFVTCWAPLVCVAGLSALNVSLDTLRPDRFEHMTRRRGHERVMAAIQHALRLGFDPVKVPLPPLNTHALILGPMGMLQWR